MNACEAKWNAPARRLTFFYIVALGTVALLSIAGQAVIQHAISTQTGDARVINIAGRQRMLSQRLAKHALAIERSEVAAQRTHHTAELSNTLDVWTQSHGALRSRTGALGEGATNSREVLRLFESIAAPFETMKEAALNILTHEDVADIGSHVDRLLANETSFLTGMDKIVFQYETEARYRLTVLRRVEYSLLALTLTVLLAEGVLIFQPITRHIRRAFERVQSAEQRETSISSELEIILDTVPALIWYQDREGGIVRLNRAASDTFGASLDNKSSATIYDCFGPAGNVLQADDRDSFAAGRGPAPRLVTFNDVHGRALTLRVLKVLRFDDTEQTVGTIALAEDVTETCELERQLVGVRREEQRRIGRDLHDDLGQVLTGILYLSRQTRNRLAPEQHAEAESMKEISRLVKESITRVRELSKGLRPLDDGPANFSAALEALAAETERLSDVECSFTCSLSDDEPDGDAGEHLFRMAQEAVSNAVRHSGCERIGICVERQIGSLIMTIEDDGSGFHFAANTGHEGIGLRIMRRRAELLGATLEVSGESGTRVRCIMPVFVQLSGTSVR